VTPTLPDLIGFVGVACVVVTYLLSQIGRMDATAPAYPAINGVGAVMILVSLYFRPNPASLAIEFFWLVISVVGFIRAMMKRR
jgi:hypothetical protein